MCHIIISYSESVSVQCKWHQSVFGVQLVVQFAHPPGQLLLLHLVVTRLDCFCSIVKAFDQDLLGEEPKEI